MPVGWGTEDEEMGGNGGPRHFGQLYLKYTSDAAGCKPDIPTRKLLMKKVLAGSERDI